MKTELITNLIIRSLVVCFFLILGSSSSGNASTNESAFPEGYHDGNEGEVEANNCSAFGWAVDPDNRLRDLDIRILSDDEPIPVATAVANLLREDVSACPGGTCGFEVGLWGLISAGEEHKITVHAFDVETVSWVDLSATPKNLTCWGYPEGSYDGEEGKVDSNNCSAFGWVVDPDNRERDLEVRILSDDDPVPVATAVADHLRQDVSACSGGTCGFNVDLWGLISAGETHKITVQAYDLETTSWVNLGAKPKDLYCQPNIYIPIILHYEG